MFSFHDCLSKKYSPNSYYIRSIFFDGLKIKCFAYLPCNTSEIEQESIWFKPGLRRIGNCVDGIKVKVYNSINEYSEFMEDYEKRTNVGEILKNFDVIMHSRKKNGKCMDNFTYLFDGIVKNFVKSFLKSHDTTLGLAEDSLDDGLNNIVVEISHLDSFSLPDVDNIVQDISFTGKTIEIVLTVLAFNILLVLVLVLVSMFSTPLNFIQKY